MRKYFAVLVTVIFAVLLCGCAFEDLESAKVPTETYTGDKNTVTEESNSTNEITTEKETPPPETKEAPISIEEQIVVEIAGFSKKWSGNYVGVFVTNNSAETIGEMEVQVLFYDNFGNIISEESDGHDVVLPNSTVVSCLYAPDEYSSYDYRLDIDVDDNKRYKNHAKKVEVQTNIGEDCIILQVTNNAEVDIEEFEYAVALYKNGKIVGGCDGNDIYDIESGKTVVEKYSTYGVDFDTYEVYVNQAHTFG